MSALRERIASLPDDKRAILAEWLGVDGKAQRSGESLVAWIETAEDVSAEDVRRHCVERLPDYMVPSRFVMVDRLPRLPNGKVDRKRLSEDKVQDEKADGSFVSPRTDTERVLAEIWCTVLGLETVSVLDNFYEVGGDSILSIQVISRARQRGIEIDPADILDNQSIASLASTADRVSRKETDFVAETDEPFPLSPIQSWFFGEIGAEKRWNQSRLVKLPADISRTRAQEVLDTVIERHVALRLRFPLVDGRRMQEIAQHRDVELEVVEASEAQDFGLLLQEVLERLQASMDLEEGGLFRAAYLDEGVNGASLLLIAHHLLVDPVSWMLLIDEIVQGCTSPSDAMAEPDLSYRRWVSLAASTEIPPDEHEYWRKQSSSNAPSFLRAVDSVERDARRVYVELSVDTTAALLKLARETEAFDVSDFLLAALVKAISKRTNQRRLRIGLEQHGRAPISDVDVTTTVGWLTAFFPVEIDLSRAAGWAGLLDAVSTARKEAPRGGAGYCQIMYEGQEESPPALARPPLALFNYLGSIDTTSMSWSDAATKAGIGHGRSDTCRRAFAMEINAYVANGRLSVDWIFGQDMVDEEIAARLPAEFTDAVEKLTEELRTDTAFSFGDSGLGRDDLNRLMDRLSRDV